MHNCVALSYYLYYSLVIVYYIAVQRLITPTSTFHDHKPLCDVTGYWALSQHVTWKPMASLTR